MSNINERIKEMRLKRNLTLQEVAEYLGVKEATVQRYESGSIKNIKYEAICKMAELFECDPVYLMGWKNTFNATNSNGTVVQGVNSNVTINDTSNIYNGLSEQEQELLKIFRSVSPKGQVHMLNVAYEAEKKYKRGV